MPIKRAGTGGRCFSLRMKLKTNTAMAAMNPRAMSASIYTGNVLTMVSASLTSVRSVGSKGSCRMETLILSLTANKIHTTWSSREENSSRPVMQYTRNTASSAGRKFHRIMVGLVSSSKPTRIGCWVVMRNTRHIATIALTRSVRMVFFQEKGVSFCWNQLKNTGKTSLCFVFFICA